MEKMILIPYEEYLELQEINKKYVLDDSHINGIPIEYFLHIDYLELSIRAYNVLKNEDLNYIGDLVCKREAKMLKMSNFGRKSLNEIKEILKRLNLNFAGYSEEEKEWEKPLYAGDISVQEKVNKYIRIHYPNLND